MCVYNLLTCHVNRDPNLKMAKYWTIACSLLLVQQLPTMLFSRTSDGRKHPTATERILTSTAFTHVDAMLFCHLDNVHSECLCRFPTSYQQLTGKNQLEITAELEVN